MFDAHCHLDDFEDYVDVLQRAKDVGVTGILTCGTGVGSSRKLLDIAEKSADVYIAVGLGYEGETKETDFEILKRLINESKKVVAIGECGLDEKVPNPELFAAHVRLAQEIAKPLVVHCRNMFEQTYEMVKTANVAGMLHCFTGSEEWMKRLVDLGWYISFGGILTFKKSDELRGVARLTPRERILIETDAPYLAPEPIRGKRNEPAQLQLVAEMLARTRGERVEQVLQYTSENAQRLLQI